MPTITFPKNALRAYLKGTYDDETLKNAISMIGTDLDRFEEEVSVEVFPNRPDLLSVPGLARALNHFLGDANSIDTYTVKPGTEKVVVRKTAAAIRPHTRCCIVRGIVYTEEKIQEVIDIQEKLHGTFGRNRKKVAIGIYPMEKITFPITFGSEKPEHIVFRPLELQEEMDAQQMLATHPAGKTYGGLLHGCSTYPVFRDANGNVLSVPPIINSHEIGRITPETRDVFIECSGHDERALEQALTMIACALQDMGGTVESMTVEYPDWHIVCPNLTPRTMRIDLAYVATRAGIPRERLPESLAKMGLQLKGDLVTIPCYRTDFFHEVDIVEDACIGYGYENIIPTIPQKYTVGSLSKDTVLQRVIREVLTGAGLQELITFYLTDRGIPIENPSTETHSHLRTELIRQQLDLLSKNTSNAYPQRVFEIGIVFREDAKAETRVAEEPHLAVMLCGEDAGYTHARQILDLLARALLWNITYEEHDDERFIPGRCARITGTVEGVIGEIHPELITAYGIVFPIAAFEVRV